MKLLLDQNLSYKLCARLADCFPGTTQVQLLGLAEADDRTIWDHARANGFTLVTYDADFSELALLLGSPPKVIWLRKGNLTSAEVERLLLANASSISEFIGAPEDICLELY